MPESSLSPLEQANDLLGRMTLREKAQQVSAIMPTALLGPDGPDDKVLDEIMKDGIGHVSNLAMMGAASPHNLATITNKVQHYLRENTRLGIPAMFHAEALNGFLAPGYTSFPTAIGLAATWNPDAVEEMARVISRQMRSVGSLHALSPVLDIARDARWGRVHETYGEDVYLTTAMGVGFVRGLQGDDLREGVLATAKHFLGYAMTEAGQNMAATQLGERELYDVYATPFEAAIKLAGLGSVMNSYSEIDGVPVGASHAILTELLRDRMGFTGSVVSDYSTVEWLATRQFIAPTAADAGLLALTAGLDVELPSVVGYGGHLVHAVEDGRLDESVLDEAVRRVLVDKFALDLFENPYVNEDPIELNRIAAEGQDLSRSLAEESITLLKNDGTLPLQRGVRIAVIGPNADSAMVNFAAYTYPSSLDMTKGIMTGESRMAGVSTMSDSSPEISPEEAVKRAEQYAQLMSIDTDALVRHSYGAMDLAEALRTVSPTSEVTSTIGVNIRPDDPQDVAAAVEAAAAADIVVLAIGGRGGWFGTRITEGEGTDAAKIELPPHQVELVRAVSATGTPLVGVYYQGRPYAIADVDELLAASLVAYYPGPYGSQAVASVLFGDANPSGKLPYTIPRATGQVPLYYSQKRGSGYRRSDGDMFRSYIDLENSPLYPFGHGASFTSFEYSNATVSADTVPTDGGAVTITVQVTNTGERAGSEIVQFYISQAVIGITRPELQLVGFARAMLAPQETGSFSCTVQASQLGFTGIDGRFVVEPGPAAVRVGSSSDQVMAAVPFTLTGDTVDLEGQRSYLSKASTTQLNPTPDPKFRR
ncbi:glycoside hydrolase family 3 C-terminal domain-containing protein [Herbiconiux sp. CPCC 203407]|uniref:Glycoside hydrolase family 3 C-terminal domain-containing protein n=1 Tax=Herbiconiux oxytropis TaxID=2970915 RepID=A0AA41XJN5_9MICO|nr:glycoside hydrolase family 3 N-terminal domain-containing protein [Herbiconiux oxytropis]MCS5721842.1 glycoside hydrolase family 3 C-terminal domain-containing protein [Herbiconiux oxytropis]MCS5727368.1 glycoside hydrolase family 3 C-terminal domain-containing protein [Herbiconiux oxytropis]